MVHNLQLSTQYSFVEAAGCQTGGVANVTTLDSGMYTLCMWCVCVVLCVCMRVSVHVHMCMCVCGCVFTCMCVDVVCVAGNVHVYDLVL